VLSKLLLSMEKQLTFLEEEKETELKKLRTAKASVENQLHEALFEHETTKKETAERTWHNGQVTSRVEARNDVVEEIQKQFFNVYATSSDSAAYRKYVRVMGAIDGAQLEELGFTGAAEPQLTNNNTFQHKPVLFESVLQPRFFELVDDVPVDAFHPQRAFKHSSEGHWCMIREEDEIIPESTTPLPNGKVHIFPSKVIHATWVKNMRKEYGAKAEAILQYLLNKYEEFSQGGAHATSSLPRIMWNREEDREMNAAEKLAVLLDLRREAEKAPKAKKARRAPVQRARR